MAPGMKKIKSGPDSPGGVSVSPSDVVSFVKSLYTDEWRWQISKSIALFAAAVYVTRAIADNPDMMAEPVSCSVWPYSFTISGEIVNFYYSDQLSPLHLYIYVFVYSFRLRSGWEKFGFDMQYDIANLTAL